MPHGLRRSSSTPSGPETGSMLAADNNMQTNNPRTPRRMPETAGQDMATSEHEAYDEEDFTYSLFGPIRTGLSSRGSTPLRTVTPRRSASDRTPRPNLSTQALSAQTSDGSRNDSYSSNRRTLQRYNSVSSSDSFRTAHSQFTNEMGEIYTTMINAPRALVASETPASELEILQDVLDLVTSTQLEDEEAEYDRDTWRSPTLEAQLMEAVRAYDHCEARASRLVDANDELSARVASLERQLVTSMEGRSAADAPAIAIVEDNESLPEELASFRTSLDEAEMKFEAAEITISDLVKEKSQLSDEVLDLKSQMEQAQEDRITTVNKASILEGKEKVLLDQVVDLKDLLKNSQDVQQYSQKSVSDLSKEKRLLENKVTELEDQVAEAQAARAKEALNFVEDKEILSDKVNDLQKLLYEAEKELAPSQEEIDPSIEVAGLRTAHHRIKGELTAAKLEMLHMQDYHATEITKFRYDINEVTNSLQYWYGKAIRLKAEKDSMKTRLLQLNAQNLERLRNASHEQLSDLLRANLAVSKENERLRAQVQTMELFGVGHRLEMSQLGEDNRKVGTQIAVLEAKVDLLRESLEREKDQVTQLEEEKKRNPQDFIKLASRIEDLQISIEKNHARAESVQDEKTSSKEVAKLLSQIKDLQGSLKNEQMRSAQLEEDKKANFDGNSRLLSQIVTLKKDLKKEQTAHEKCKAKLMDAQATNDKLAMMNTTGLWKITELERKIEIQKPLVDIGVLTRRAWWERAKQYQANAHHWVDYRGAGDANKKICRDASSRAERPDIAADTALFILGILADVKDRDMYLDIYKTPLTVNIRTIANPQTVAEISTMKAALTDRLRYWGFDDRDYTGSDRFKELEQEVRAQYGRRLMQAGLTASPDASELKTVQDMFDEDEDVEDMMIQLRKTFERDLRRVPRRY